MGQARGSVAFAGALGLRILFIVERVFLARTELKSTRLALLLSVELIALVSALVLTLGAVVALTSLLSFVMGTLPWTYDRILSFGASRTREERIRTALQTLESTFRGSLPALVRRGATAGSFTESDTLSTLEASEALDEAFVEDMASVVVEGLCDQALSEELGDEVVRAVLVFSATTRVERRFHRGMVSMVKSFIGEQVSFTSSGPAITGVGERFLKIVAYLRTYGAVTSMEDLREHLAADLGVREKEELSLEFSDPLLSLLVYELGKGGDLLELVNRKMSGRRLLRGLTRGGRRYQNRPLSYSAFLVLKQERRGGSRFLKKRIDDVSERIVSSGTLYAGARHARYQSVNVLRMPRRYKNARELLSDHFSVLTGLPNEEAERAGLVAVPLAIDGAAFFPENPSGLRPAQQDFYRLWRGLLKLDRREFQMLLDFGVTFFDLLDYLTLDFLVKNLTQGEKEFLNQKTGPTMSDLGVTNLLDVARIPAAHVAASIRRQGYPTYRSADLLSYVETYTGSLKQFLDRRLEELAAEIVDNANRILLLRRPAAS